jgi:hypothetical protein
MLIIAVLQAICFIMLLCAAWLIRRIPQWKATAARTAFPVVLTTAVILAGSLAYTTAIFLQEKKGISMGVSGGLSSDARQWLAQHRDSKPARNEVGNNLKVLAEGLSFLRPRNQNLSPAIQARVADLSRIPEKPTRLLNSSEQTKYYEAAVEVQTVIEQLAGQSPTP